MTNLTKQISRHTAVILVLFTFFAYADKVAGQIYGVRDHWYIGPQIGLVSFFGDLSVHDFDPARKISDESDLGLGFIVGKSVNRLMDVRVNYLHGKMKGSNPGVDMYFKSNFDELGLGLTISLSRLILPFKAT